MSNLGLETDFQSPSLPVDINTDDPAALAKIIDIAKQLVIKNNEYEQRIRVLEKICLDE